MIPREDYAVSVDAPRGSWERFLALEGALAAVDEDAPEPHPELSLLRREWEVFGSLYELKAFNYHNAVEKGFILMDWVLDSLSFADVRRVQGIDGNSSDHENEGEVVAVCGNKVAVYRDATVPCIRLINLENSSSEDWVIPAALYWEGGLRLIPSHNPNFFILKTDQNTYLADIREKKFVPIPFVWEGRTPRIDIGPPYVEISPLLVPAAVWQEHPDVLDYQPCIARIIHCFPKQDPTEKFIPGQFDTHKSSRVFFHPLDSDVPKKPQFEYLDSFTAGVMGPTGSPSCLRYGPVYTLNSETHNTPCLQEIEVAGEFSFHSNVNPYFMYLFETRAGDKIVPKLRWVGGWQAGETQHLLTETEAKALETDVSAFIPNPRHPDSLLCYATNPARLRWKVPQRTRDNIVSERLVTLLNALQQEHEYDFYPLHTSSQDPESLVFRGEKVDSSTILIVNPFQDPPKSFFVNYVDPPYHFSLLLGRRPKREAFSVKAKDGTTLYGYVTHPSKRLSHNPGLLWLHGGPAAREEWGSGEGQLYHVSRGYAVITINRLGSEGYGKHFQDKIYQNYGTIDLEDNMAAVRYAVEQNWVNSQFMVVAGGSYGAYAAMRMAEEFPDSFKGVMAENGFYRVLEKSGSDRDQIRHIGLDPLYVEDEKKLDAQSALSKVSRIKCPSLILHGDEDTICPIECSEELVKEMKKHGKEVCFVRFEGGKHKLTDLGNLRVRFLLQELFLARILKGHAAIPTDEFKGFEGEIVEGAAFLGLEGWEKS